MSYIKFQADYSVDTSGKYSWLSSNSFQILLFVFIATIFYAKSPEYRVFRIIYSIFLYLSLWKLLVFYNSLPKLRTDLPDFFKVYLLFALIFIIINLTTDFRNPALNFVTLVNNPYGFLAILNIMAFGLGYVTKDLTGFYQVLKFVCVLFAILCFLPYLPKFEGFHGYICSYAVVPFFILSNYYKKNKLISYVLIFLACMYSISSGYRIIMLRVIVFFFLFFTILALRKHNFLKLALLLFTCAAVYEFIANLPDILRLFGGLIEVKSFETDTRSFLYKELFEDLSLSETILGRGFLGTYFSFYFLNIYTDPEGGLSFERFTNEVGFLQLILKGGLLYYIIFVTPLLVSSLKAMFNKMIPALPFVLSIFLFSELLLMFFENIPNYGFNFFNLFFLAGFIYNESKKREKNNTHSIMTKKLL